MVAKERDFWRLAVEAQIVAALGIPVAAVATVFALGAIREFSGPSGGALLWLLCAGGYPVVWFVCLLVSRAMHKGGDDFVAVVFSMIPVLLAGVLALSAFGLLRTIQLSAFASIVWGALRLLTSQSINKKR